MGESFRLDACFIFPSMAWPLYVKASVAWHAGAGLAAVAIPSAWPWALGAVAANHALLTAAGLVPRSRLLGSNWTRLPPASAARGEIAITIDDGPDAAVTPAVLDVLAAHGVRATFFCIAERMRSAAPLCRRIVASGHSVQNHSARHLHTFTLLGPRALRRELAEAQQTIADITGIVPRFFRAPAGLRNPLLPPILDELGLQLVSWTRRGFDTAVASPQRVLAQLERGLAAGDIVVIHDGNAARAADRRPVALVVLPALLARVAERGLHGVTLPQAADGTAATVASTAASASSNGAPASSAATPASSAAGAAGARAQR